MRKKIALTALLILLVSTNAWAVSSYSFDPPDTVLAATTGVEIIEYAGAVWVATGAGVNFTFDNGQTWLLYDSTNGLSSDNISAIFSQNNRLWVGANHSELVDNSPTSIADGLFYTDDMGDNWIQYDFDLLGIDKVYGASRQVFDIAGHYDAGQNENWIFFAAFAGAILGSQDGGTTWRRIFPSVNDSISFTNDLLPSLRMRYFSCETDTSHGDTLSLWGGTAGGIYQYVYIPNREKNFAKSINQIAFCDDCTDSAGSYIFIAGNTAFTRGTKRGAPFNSRFLADGLTGNHITSVHDFRGRVFAGTANTGGTSSNGLTYSDDRGDSFTPDNTFNSTYALPGNSNMIRAFTVIGERLYMAAQEAGIFVSVDSGANWTQVLPDSSDITSANRRNVVWSLEAVADTIRVGTDSGLVQLFLDPIGLIDSSRFYVFGEDSVNADRVMRIRTQRFFADSAMTILDSSAIWTVNNPTTINGNFMVGRSNDGGVNWDRLQIGQGVADFTRDINFKGQDTVYFVGAQGVRFIPTYPVVNPFSSSIQDSTTTDNLNNNVITNLEIHGDTIIFGTDNGIAISNNRGARYKIHRSNVDSLKADAVIQLTQENLSPLLDGITGNFIPAMEVQPRGTGSAIVWASCRPTLGGSEGIAAGAVIIINIDSSATPFDTVYGRAWLSQYDQFAWNFAFLGDTVFAATDNGVVYSSDTGFTWDTMQYIDTSGNELYPPTAPVFGVAAIDSFLWVGGDDRILRVNLFDLSTEGFFVVDTTTAIEEVYAFPVPYSNVQNSGDGITFRFALEQDAYVTIEVYDFAMNLVRRVIDNQFYSAGFYPTATISANWDALNGKSDELAVGMYYFKIELSTGETRWGKLAVIP